MESSHRGLLFAIAVLILGLALVLLYRSASHDELPEDEWVDFEHPNP